MILKTLKLWNIYTRTLREIAQFQVKNEIIFNWMVFFEIAAIKYMNKRLFRANSSFERGKNIQRDLIKQK